MSAINEAGVCRRYGFADWTLKAVRSWPVCYFASCLICGERSKDQPDADAAQLWCLKHAGLTRHSGYELAVSQLFNAAVKAPPADRLTILVPADLTKALAGRAEALPAPAFTDGLLAPAEAEAYERGLRELPDALELACQCREFLDDEDGEGFVVLRMAGFREACRTSDDFLKAVTALLTLIATPLRAIDDRELWFPLDGTGGYVPLHLDLPNSTWPPDYVALLCVRPDRWGGGRSLVSQARRAVARLDDSDAELLTHQRYECGPLDGLKGVGVEWRRFPVIDGMATRGGYVRVAPDMLADADPEDPYVKSAHALTRELIVGQRELSLNSGDLLIVNQHLTSHGRAPLGDEQEAVPEDERQLILKSFLRRQGRTS
ncbi:DUF7848 domain-containing protein [Streptomyces luteolus]|uniref:TauD/TfdA family dioxygenase n=1 Tax=Streptomyces luteolus TaxID=3043615 RepID=A0ABT6SRH4_9ACTN|nr:TauD/TfdA family dioxygenase [Streptomyces sp. B-S-A12]MDI3417965.1 TauD/TfdA family dioxygenase [Streptomyces sp. B-S-A12]